MPYPFPSFTTGHMCAAEHAGDAPVSLAPVPIRRNTPSTRRIHRPKAERRPPTVPPPRSYSEAPTTDGDGGGARRAPLWWVAILAPYVVPLTVTKKSLSLSDGDFAITDANGAVVLKVKGAIFSIRSRRTILDGAGMPLLTMQEKEICPHWLVDDAARSGGEVIPRRPHQVQWSMRLHQNHRPGTHRSSVYPDLGCGLASSDGQENLLWLSQVTGTITAPPASSWSEKKNHWLMFYLVDGLTATQQRPASLDGIGQTWWVDKCKADNDALVVMNCTDMELSQFSSKDSPQIHIGLSMSGKVNVTQLTITAPENSPNTDGVHVDRSEDVHITGSTIGTGDYCISIGPESRFVTVDGIVSGPGHGVRPLKCLGFGRFRCCCFFSMKWSERTSLSEPPTAAWRNSPSRRSTPNTWSRAPPPPRPPLPPRWCVRLCLFLPHHDRSYRGTHLSLLLHRRKAHMGKDDGSA
ncbi:hypothetical protein ZWY2020_000836 [Hordeum vulgare]|nr:hypothetical protein ZWY2020_000836 [Hordeum vulgare]